MQIVVSHPPVGGSELSPPEPLAGLDTPVASAVETSADTATKLNVIGLRKTYGGVTALSDASFKMKEGEFLTLLGPSGSGKTTLLWLIAGLIQPDRGEIWIERELATYAPPHARDIGVVFQNYALFPHMTVQENISFPMQMRRWPEQRIRTELARVLDVVQLPHVAGRYPRELSGGQQQRIALARCMVYQPSIILMDEPLGALDKKLRTQMQMEIKGLHLKYGITILYVTHDQEEALAMSDRICLMNEGQIEQIGTPHDLYFQPVSLFAADFLGDSNFFSGALSRDEGGAWIVRTSWGLQVRVGRTQTGLRPGDAVNVMVRPESLKIIRGDEALDNQTDAVVKDVVLAGSITKYFAAMPDGASIVVSELTQAISSSQTRKGPIRIGWSLQDCIALAVEPPRS